MNNIYTENEEATMVIIIARDHSGGNAFYRINFRRNNYAFPYPLRTSILPNLLLKYLSPQV